ncbi:glycosyltransferase family 2 protein [Flavobacterium sp. MC2016-06]|uniref:glycosyltransferase family 2 protein n=1 Tax=Flavobacterium sp. MC2016-06 TaxID=2676308 RepID=UPI0018AC8DD5|nr:glycosyltransferase family 2 protein [Flavobacterium sp. MC2016-06]MBU3858661.1 glycosyltransferase [Flavobacterium sp. MC2016-06]
MISVIVPNYNHEKYLKQRLESIFNQTYDNFEVILLDDCSTDNSVEILSGYAKKSKVTHCAFNDKNSGNTFTQWSKGVALAKGEYIWIAESDDFCTPNFIEEVIKPLLGNSEIILSYCQSHRTNENGAITGNWITHTDNLTSDFFSKDFEIEGNLFIEKFLIFKNVIPNASAVIFRKDICLEEYLQIGEGLRYCGDWVLYFKMILNNKLVFVSESHNYFRYHNKSVIANAVKEKSKVYIIDVELEMRKELIRFLKQKRIPNQHQISASNKIIIKSLKYEKGFLLIHSNQKSKGFFVLLSVFDEFVKRYKFKKNLRIKFKRLIS